MVNVYIIQSLKNKRYYTGISVDIEKRLDKHNKGQVRSTKNWMPWRLVYKETYESYFSARIREKEIKSYKVGNSFKLLIKE